MPTAVSAFSFAATGPATNSTPSAPASSESDENQSFSDALREHGGDDSTPTSAAPNASAAATPNTPASTTTTPAATPTGKDAKAVPQATIHNVQEDAWTAKALATSTPTVVPTDPAKAKAAPATTTPLPAKTKAAALPAGSDLSSMLVQASVLGSTLPTTPLTVTGPVTAGVVTGPQQATVPTLTSQTTQLATSTAVSVSTALAHAAQAATGTGTEVPSTNPAKGSSGASPKEKKSESQTLFGNFIQQSNDTSTDHADTLAALRVQAPPTAQSIDSKTLTTPNNSRFGLSSSFSQASQISAGTANGDKAKTMNSDANISAMLTATGTNAAAQETATDANILLSSNADFHSALQQVMHIAQLSESSSTAAPTRVAIELQTPPGAIVNVYVTKQDDQYRAQLSTNDATALSWVQDKMSSIKSTDLGVEVKWLPPQLESTTTTVATSSSESNLNWNRDGQQQQNGSQQQEERSPRHRDTEPVEEVAGVSASSFFSNLTGLGRAA